MLSGLGLKAIWYGAEGFGNLIGLTKAKKEEKTQSDRKVLCAPGLGLV